MAQKLFIGGLSFSTTNDELRAFFAQCGEVTSANIVTDQMSGRSRGFGFVEMASAEEAAQAVSQLNGRELDGRRLKVEIAKPQGSYTGGARAGMSRGAPRARRW